MKLLVRVIEARNLPQTDSNGLSDPYVKLQVGKQRFRTKVVKNCLNPTWGEEFKFRVEDLKKELVISVLDQDKYFNDDFVGQIRVPVSRIFDTEHKSLGTCWYSLQPKHSNKSKANKNYGEIHLSICFIQNIQMEDLNSNVDHASQLEKHAEMGIESPSRSFSGASGSSSPVRSEEFSLSKEEKSCQKTVAARIAQIFNKGSIADNASAFSERGNDLADPLDTLEPEVSDDKTNHELSSSDFGEAMRTMESRDEGREMPSNLPGGVLVDQMYGIAPKELNSLLFSPESSFPRTLADLQKTTEFQMLPWKFDNSSDSLKRVLTYLKAATKLLKATKGTEEQTYLKADGKFFAVLASVSTPDVIYGSTFKTELLYCIRPGLKLPSGEETAQLVISWRTNFLQSTMMKGMIESGARQGLKDSFEQYSTCLSQMVRLVDPKEFASEMEQILGSLQAVPQSDWKLALQYFANFTVVSTIFMGFYVLIHMWLLSPSSIQGLEFVGLDLPDSIGEFIVCGVLVLQGERVLGLISRFIQARAQKGSDHGVKARGDGWLLTVALIEGSNLAAVDSSGFCDPYVVFTCNGKSRTSSIKFQKPDPRWNEVFEFDAMDEPPSMMEVDVYDFDGPFDEATSLGHAEINFVKSNISDLADVWVPLQGKLAQACQSRLHLRIFLNNTRGNNVVSEYLSKMEKEVGKKISLRSPQTNSAFQKLFGLPPEEFLINDFTCHLKRKMPLQGRLFLSARIIGFHANLFGHKTTFFFLWEDIEDIQVVAPTLSSMGSPIIVITLRKGRGIDAKHGAKVLDEEGRLRYHFQTFVSFNVAHRTIMALWKARSLTPEQKVQLIEEETETKILQGDESGSFMGGVEDVVMSEVYSAVVPVPINYLMELFSGSEMERRVMEKAGCHNYSYTPWELEKDDVYERQIYYRFDKRISSYRGELTSTQQKYPASDQNGWLVEEVATLHGIPLGDYFDLHLKFQIGDSPARLNQCHVHVFFGLAWMKSARHQKRITKNIVTSLHDRLKVIFSVVEREFAAT